MSTARTLFARLRLLARSPALFLSLACAAGVADAHTFEMTIGEAAGSTHYFGVICSTDGGYETDHLFLQIRTHTPIAPVVNALVVKGSVATSISDTLGGDALSSPASRTRGGNGLYQILVNKSGAGAATFSLIVHCLDVTGTQHTGTDGLVYQYQDR